MHHHQSKPPSNTNPVIQDLYLVHCQVYAGDAAPLIVVFCLTLASPTGRWENMQPPCSVMLELLLLSSQYGSLSMRLPAIDAVT